MELLLGIRYLAKMGDYMFSFDLKHDFFRAWNLPIPPRLPSNKRPRRIYRIAGLPMGWWLNFARARSNLSDNFGNPTQAGIHN
jgi:hypothetical protein